MAAVQGKVCGARSLHSDRKILGLWAGKGKCFDDAGVGSKDLFLVWKGSEPVLGGQHVAKEFDVAFAEIVDRVEKHFCRSGQTDNSGGNHVVLVVRGKMLESLNSCLVDDAPGDVREHQKRCTRLPQDIRLEFFNPFENGLLVRSPEIELDDNSAVVM